MLFISFLTSFGNWRTGEWVDWHVTVLALGVTMRTSP
jgi:hypothetical protein